MRCARLLPGGGGGGGASLCGPWRGSVPVPGGCAAAGCAFFSGNLDGWDGPEATPGCNRQVWQLGREGKKNGARVWIGCPSQRGTTAACSKRRWKLTQQQATCLVPKALWIVAVVVRLLMPATYIRHVHLEACGIRSHVQPTAVREQDGDSALISATVCRYLLL